jgi:hypothetical protein
MKTRLTTTLAAIVLAGFAPGFASANIIDFSFVTAGTLQANNCGFLCYSIHTQGTAYDFTDEVAGTSSWTFSGNMTFFGVPWIAGSSGGPSYWSFSDDSSSGNDLSGTFGWTLLGGIGTAIYDITGGSGLFAGASGSGGSIIAISNWYADLPEFIEVGKMKVSATPVAEPDTTSLVAAGLLLLGFVAWRRRKVNVTRD